MEPEYQQRPIRIGSLLLQPALSVLGAYASNVFNRRDASGDAMTLIMPGLTVGTDLPRHEVKLAAGGTLRRFARHTTENSEEFDIAARGKLELSPLRMVNAAIDYAQLIEPRSSLGTVADAAEPVSYARRTADAGADLAFGRLRLLPSAGYQEVQYDPLSLTSGRKADLSFRDARTVRGAVRLGYDFSGLVSAYVSATWSDIRSTSAPADIRRDARNVTALVGLAGALSPVISGKIGVGYQRRNYELPIYRDFSGATFEADLQWYVTPLTTLQLQAGRTFENSAYREVAGILNDRVTLAAYYDPLRNLGIALSATYERGRYRDVDTRTSRKSVSLNAKYHLNRAISLGSYLALVRQDVEGTPLVSEFTSLSAGVGITITP